MKVLIEDKEAICEEQAKREDMSSSDGLDAPPPLCPSIISLDEAIPSLNSGEDVPWKACIYLTSLCLSDISRSFINRGKWSKR